MGGVIQQSKLVYRDADLVDSAVGIWCPSFQGPGGITLVDQVESADGVFQHAAGVVWINDNGPALNFGGAGADYINCGVHSRHETQDFTWSAWIYPRSTSIIVGGKCDNIFSGGWESEVGPSNQLSFAYYDGAVRGWYSTANNAITLNAWQHIAFRWSPDRAVVDFFVDGNLSKSVATASSPIVYNGDSLDIGKAHVNASWNGLQDDVRLFPHALAHDQIKRLYSGGQGRGIGLRPSYVEYEPIRTLSYPNLRKGRVAAYSAGEQGPGGLVLRDQVGANHGTLTNGPTWVNDEGPALSFDGTNDYVAVGDVLSQPNSFSVSFWVQFSADDASTIIIAGYSYPDTGYLIRRSTSAPSDGVNFWLDSGTEDEVSTAANSAVLNTWQHYACTYDGTIASIYLDGDHHESKAIAYVSAASPVGIGLAGGAGVHMEGLLDDINIYKRALSPQEIRQLYNGGIRGAAYEMDGLASPFVTQWGSVAAAAAFQAAWGANATTVAGIASGF